MVLGTTVLTYLFNIYALKHLSPSTIGAFIYLQPVVATVVALWVGADQLTPLRCLTALMIFIGVYLSSQKRTKTAYAAPELINFVSFKAPECLWILWLLS